MPSICSHVEPALAFEEMYVSQEEGASLPDLLNTLRECAQESAQAQIARPEGLGAPRLWSPWKASQSISGKVTCSAELLN